MRFGPDKVSSGVEVLVHRIEDVDIGLEDRNCRKAS